MTTGHFTPCPPISATFPYFPFRCSRICHGGSSDASVRCPKKIRHSMHETHGWSKDDSDQRPAYDCPQGITNMDAIIILQDASPVTKLYGHKLTSGRTLVKWTERIG
ncbi:hypothetical protein ElyMa_000616700 [Elysia marginata]|uniref:Uncharacterized protein n=1 Tax=Elysia marginata TaxID=1093978 RepID=A0AAV4G9Q6_9GAST|nr:hypothetical protein ElyMa_000616700 [Elysia marginata]